MANEKTPLLLPTPKADEFIVKIPADYDINHNEMAMSLTYEELLPFVIDPSWIHLRKICSTTCFISFFVILLAACIIAHSSMTENICGSLIAVNSDVNNTQIESVTDAFPNGILTVIFDGLNSTVSS